MDQHHGGDHARSLRLVTIGYEGRSLERLITDLIAADVDLLVDVRLKAMSRKVGFAKSTLSRGCTEAGIEYVHEPSLGNPRENREPFHRGDAHAIRIFEDRMHSVGTDALQRIADRIRERHVALLCYEFDARICHRSSIAAALCELVPDLTVDDR